MSGVSSIKVSISKNSIDKLNANNTSFNVPKQNSSMHNISVQEVDDFNLNTNEIEENNTISHKIANVLEAGWDNLKLSTGAVVGYGFKIFGGMSDQDFQSVMSDIEEENKAKSGVYSAITGILEPGEQVIKSGNQNFEDLVNGQISIEEYISKTGSTMTSFNISILEGIGNWGEKVADALILLGGKAINFDLKKFHIINEEQYNNNMNNVKEYVKEEGIKGLFDELYDTEFGSTYKDGADNFDTVRQFGNMTGETAMNIGMAYVGGQAGLKFFGTAASSSKAAAISSSVSSGIAGFGEGAQDAYKKGANVNQGIGAGALRGGFNALQYLLGAKINNYNPYESEIRNALGHVALDAADGSLEGFITPFIDMTYRNGYNTGNGEYVQFDDSTSLADKYSHLFEENGGWANVGTQAFMGGLMSAASEAGGIAKHFRNENNLVSKNINNIEVKESDNNNSTIKLRNNTDDVVFESSIKSDTNIKNSYNFEEFDSNSFSKFMENNVTNLSINEKDQIINKILELNLLDMSNKDKFTNNALYSLLVSDPYITNKVLSDSRNISRVKYLIEKNPDCIDRMFTNIYKQIDSVETLNTYLDIDCIKEWIDDLDGQTYYNFIGGLNTKESIFESPIILDKFKKLDITQMNDIIGYMNLGEYIKNNKEKFKEFFAFYDNIEENFKHMSINDQLQILKKNSILENILDENQHGKMMVINNRYNDLIKQRLESFPGVTYDGYTYKIAVPGDYTVYDLVTSYGGKEITTTLKRTNFNNDSVDFELDLDDKAHILKDDFKILSVNPNYEKSSLILKAESGTKYKIEVESNGKIKTLYRETSSWDDILDLSKNEKLIDKVISVSKIDEVLLPNNVDEFSVNDTMRGAREIFIDEHYGGNQSDVPKIIKNPTNEIEIQKKKLIESLTNKYYENASDLDICNLTEHYASCGCGYMAVANAVATYFSGMENGAVEFKKRFGFDLDIANNGSVSKNVEAIAYELYLYKQQQIHGTTIDNNIFRGSGGLRGVDYPDIVIDFMKEKQIDLDINPLLTYGDIYDANRVRQTSDFEQLISMINSNNKDTFMILNANKFDLELMSESFNSLSKDEALSQSNIEGKKIKNIGGHAMMITGADSNNNLIVSSWSDKFKFNLNDFDKIEENSGMARVIPLRFNLINNN